MRIINVVGARPNFMKIAPLMEAYARHGGFEPVLVHTGQHYDQAMSDLFFNELGIPEPHINLEVGSASHAQQTAAIMRAFEPVLIEHRPNAVLVVGDVNSTVACGLVAVKLGLPLVHVEAGLRSGDRSMPEEINRLLTDTISDLLFCTEQSGIDNLAREGVSPEQVFLVGNVMVDTLLKHLEHAARSPILGQLGLEHDAYVLLTLHRPSNVDDSDTLAGILDALDEIQRDRPIVFPVHPRTRKQLETGALADRVKELDQLKLVPPAGYLDFVQLMRNARLMLTDSGGVQEETTILKVPCLTLRDNTERPVTITHGTNRLVGSAPADILEGYRRALELDRESSPVPPLWDGQAAVRIADILAGRLG